MSNNEKEIENWITYIVENEYGHVNWKFTDTLSAEQLKNIQDKELGFKLPSFVIFYDDEEKQERKTEEDISSFLKKNPSFVRPLYARTKKRTLRCYRRRHRRHDHCHRVRYRQRQRQKKYSKRRGGRRTRRAKTYQEHHHHNKKAIFPEPCCPLSKYWKFP